MHPDVFFRLVRITVISSSSLFPRFCAPLPPSSFLLFCESVVIVRIRFVWQVYLYLTVFRFLCPFLMPSALCFGLAEYSLFLFFFSLSSSCFKPPSWTTPGGNSPPVYVCAHFCSMHLYIACCVCVCVCGLFSRDSLLNGLCTSKGVNLCFIDSEWHTGTHQ